MASINQIRFPKSQFRIFFLFNLRGDDSTWLELWKFEKLFLLKSSLENSGFFVGPLGFQNLLTPDNYCEEIQGQ